MKNLRFTGQYAVCFHDVGELNPGDECFVPDAIAANLLGRGEFELVTPRPVSKSSKLETDKPAPRGNK